jgi:hypothetical protein
LAARRRLPPLCAALRIARPPAPPAAPRSWLNFALAVDYAAGTVELWSSSGAAPLAKVVPATKADVSKSDWHVGVLRLPLDDGTQLATTSGLYYSLVWIEKGRVTAQVAASS